MEDDGEIAKEMSVEKALQGQKGREINWGVESLNRGARSLMDISDAVQGPKVLVPNEEFQEKPETPTTRDPSCDHCHGYLFRLGYLALPE